MESLEHIFSSPFRSFVTLRRKHGSASCVAKKASTSDRNSLSTHPVDLDAVFQSVMLAYSSPGDGQLQNLNLPTSIAKVMFNPAVLASQYRENSMNVGSTGNHEDRLGPRSGFSGDVAMYFDSRSNAAIQVDQVNFKPIGTIPNDDRKMFYKMYFLPSKPDGPLAVDDIPVTQYDIDLLCAPSRIAHSCLRQLDRDVPEDTPFRSESPLYHYHNYGRHMTGFLEPGENKYAEKEW